jgi:magnesium-transporting ATPase (P-type)
VAALQLFSSTKQMFLCIKYLKCLELLSTFCVLKEMLCFVSLPKGKLTFVVSGGPWRFRCRPRVLRDNDYKFISAKDLVPGDIVVIAPGTVYCDMVVVQAQQFTILVDESALTGEATPVEKTPPDATLGSATYVSTRHSYCTISAGTDILEVNSVSKGHAAGDSRESDQMRPLALVITTGSFTAKGDLLTQVLSFERHKFVFDDQVKIVMAILLLEAAALVTIVFYLLEDQWVFAWFYGK